MITERKDQRKVAKDGQAEEFSTGWDPGHDGETCKGRKSSYPRESRLLSVNCGVDATPSLRFTLLQRKQQPPDSLLLWEQKAHGKERVSDGFQVLRVSRLALGHRVGYRVFPSLVLTSLPNVGSLAGKT